MTGRRRWLLVVGGLIVVVALVAAFMRRGSDQVQYLSATVKRGEIRDAVDATGTVNAVVTVQVGSQVSGAIAKLNVDFNSHVHKGDVIALIDPSLLQGTLLQATADLENAKAAVVVSRASLAKANAALVQAKADYDRTVAMARDRVSTQQEADQATANYESAKASVDAAAATIVQAQAQVSQREAAVSVARTNLDHTVIRSPIDGTVVARNVDVGQTVAASLQAPTIFTIAQDLTKMQLYAKTDESDVGRIKVGAPVTFKVDAFPKEVFQGTVSQIRMNATTVQNVVTYDAIIDFGNPALKLFPGMTAYVNIPVAIVQDAVQVPNAALRFKPSLSPEALAAVYARFGVEERSPAAGGHAPETAIVWKLATGNTLEPVQVALGITDHAYTEMVSLIKGNLKPGDEVVTTSMSAKAPAPGAQPVRR